MFGVEKADSLDLPKVSTTTRGPGKYPYQSVDPEGILNSWRAGHLYIVAWCMA